VVEVTSTAYDGLSLHARVIAKLEGFDTHANAVGELRKKLLEN